MLIKRDNLGKDTDLIVGFLEDLGKEKDIRLYEKGSQIPISSEKLNDLIDDWEHDWNRSSVVT